MQRPRRYLSHVAAACVLFQLAAFAAAPIVLSAEAPAGAVTAEQCTCASATPGAACPMHHGHGDAEKSEQDCRLRNGCATSGMALLSLAGGIGIVPSQSAAAIDQIAALIPTTLVSALHRAEFPEPPPPRC